MKSIEMILLSRKIRIIAIVSIMIMASLTIFSSPKRAFFSQKAAAFAEQPLRAERVLTEQDIAHLPDCVRRYLAYTGATGRSIPQNVFIEFDALMYRKPGDEPMKSHSVQYNFFGSYSRLFLMKAVKAGIPFSALHIYSGMQASFRVKIAGMFKVVDLSGEELTKAETVTMLNDMCIFAPACLGDKRLTWAQNDSLSVKVTLANGKYVVSAILVFNESGALVNFISDDRSALQDDGSMKLMRWTTPVSDYRDFDGRKVASSGKTIWHYPEGDFVYGEFTLRDIKYNVST